MWRIGSLIALLAALAVIAVTGAGDRGVDQASAGFDVARSTLDAALDSVASDIAEVQSSLEGRGNGDAGMADPSGPRARLTRVVERRDAIIAKLDSLEESGGDSWSGPMAGLRASVADLECRVDGLRVAARDSAATIDSLLSFWLAEAGQHLDVAMENNDGIARPFGDERALLRSRLQNIEERFIAVSTSEGEDMSARRALGEEVVQLRRSLRALMRAAHRSGSVASSR